MYMNTHHKDKFVMILFIWKCDLDIEMGLILLWWILLWHLIQEINTYDAEKIKEKK